MKQWLEEMDEVLSRLSLAFIQLERSGKCCEGLTLTQCHTLDVLSKNGVLTMNELSRRMGLAKSTMSRIVNTMVRKGWLERERVHGDKRLVSVRMTSEGNKMMKKMNRSSREYVQRILKSLPPEKIPQVIESLRWVIHSTEKETRALCSCG